VEQYNSMGHRMGIQSARDAGDDSGVKECTSGGPGTWERPSLKSLAEMAVNSPQKCKHKQSKFQRADSTWGDLRILETGCTWALHASHFPACLGLINVEISLGTCPAVLETWKIAPTRYIVHRTAPCQPLLWRRPARAYLCACGGLDMETSRPWGKYLWIAAYWLVHGSP